ncbi:MAG: hypothetical protein ABSE48_18740, partial [Verrucomicrobiota bacterium]
MQIFWPFTYGSNAIIGVVLPDYYSTTAGSLIHLTMALQAGLAFLAIVLPSGGRVESSRHVGGVIRTVSLKTRAGRPEKRRPAAFLTVPHLPNKLHKSKHHYVREACAYDQVRFHVCKVGGGKSVIQTPAPASGGHMSRLGQSNYEFVRLT